MNPFNAGSLAELEDWGPLEPPLGQPLEGAMATRGLTQWASPDGRIETGTWECEPGLSRWEFAATASSCTSCPARWRSPRTAARQSFSDQATR